MRRLPLLLAALLLAATPAFAASPRDRGSSPSQTRAAKVSTPAPAKAAAPRAQTRTAAAPARGSRPTATASRGGKATASAARRGGRIVATGGSRRSATVTAARGTAGRQAGGWSLVSYSSGPRGGFADQRFLSSAAAASPAAACRGPRRHCRAARSVSWHRDLPPAANVQAAGCPAGTMATLATGHSDVVRCMPL